MTAIEKALSRLVKAQAAMIRALIDGGPAYFVADRLIRRAKTALRDAEKVEGK